MKRAAQLVLVAKLNIDLLPNHLDGKVLGIGCRVRPYGKNADKNSMILGYGPTIEDALEDVYNHAVDGRWEPLDWAARPWGQPEANPGADIFGGPHNSF